MSARRSPAKRGTATPRWWRTAVVVLLVAACGGPAERPAPARPTQTVPRLAACPVGHGTPITGVRTTILPCLASLEDQVWVAAVHGRPEVINVWASWCRPCRRESPLLQAAHQKAGDRILFLGVDSRDSRSAALSFLATYGVTYPQVFDSAGTFASRLGIPGLPYTLFVDASGHIVYSWGGELTPDRLRYGLSRLEDRPDRRGRGSDRSSDRRD